MRYEMLIAGIAVFIVGTALLIGAAVMGVNYAPHEADGHHHSFEGMKATIYKTPECGCCDNYLDEMMERGFDVEVVDREDIDQVKEEHGVPEGMYSCHTTVIDRYVIEGHVPFEAIHRLLDEEPEIDGIAVPGMPPGSPGMGGPATEVDVYAISSGESTHYMTI